MCSYDLLSAGNRHRNETGSAEVVAELHHPNERDLEVGVVEVSEGSGKVAVVANSGTDCKISSRAE